MRETTTSILDERPRLKANVEGMRKALDRYREGLDEVSDFLRGAWYPGMQEEADRRTREVITRFGYDIREHAALVVASLPTDPPDAREEDA